jgi:hypothetical protein
MENDVSAFLDTEKNKIKEIDNRLNRLYEVKKEEIAIVTKKIEAKYEAEEKSLVREIEFIEKHLKDLEELIIECSSFDSDLLGEILQYLVSAFEKESYICQKAIHNTTEVHHGWDDRCLEKVKNEVIIIVKESKKEEEYSDYNTNIISRLIKNGDAILLSEKQQSSTKITLYKTINISTFLGIIVKNYDCGRFDYIEKFINIIMQYKIKNKLKEISKKDLLDFAKGFFLQLNKTNLSNEEPQKIKK